MATTRLNKFIMQQVVKKYYLAEIANDRLCA